MDRCRPEGAIPFWAILVCAIGVLLQGYTVQPSYASDHDVRTITGIVDEVYAGQTPPIIMVRSRPGMKDEIIVGAVVKKDANIVRGQQRIALDRIRAGERVTLVYVKNREGLMVQSIIVHTSSP